ncbi:hypothetical protein P7K49_031171 [Saguinus oedipus]|uniref:Citrate synthase n=1 Tax=Saguinus oedipus TaxID=9490 RepID=A0ABQ9U495_SAGOE|nr:hypothetical protein P7K49_031171 [Saguinus oedipus]
MVLGPLTLSWTYSFANMLGCADAQFTELMCLWLIIHSNQECSNVSAHSSHLAGGVLSDLSLCSAAAINGLAGPLHELASQEVLVWLTQLQKEVGKDVSDEKLRDYLQLGMGCSRLRPRNAKKD